MTAGPFECLNGLKLLTAAQEAAISLDRLGKIEVLAHESLSFFPGRGIQRLFFIVNQI